LIRWPFPWILKFQNWVRHPMTRNLCVRVPKSVSKVQILSGLWFGCGSWNGRLIPVIEIWSPWCFDNPPSELKLIALQQRSSKMWFNKPIFNDKNVFKFQLEEPYQFQHHKDCSYFELFVYCLVQSNWFPMCF
jgi:hypothetical protein